MATEEQACIHQSMESDLIAQEIVDDLEAALEHFRLIASDLSQDDKKKRE